MIIVHPNEPVEVKNFLRNEKIPYKEYSSLPFDYLVSVGENRIAVERKESSDFVNSIKDGRLHEQLYHMSVFTPISFLVIIGNITMALMDNKFPRQAYIGALISATLKRSPDGAQGFVSVVNLDTIYDFMLFLKYLHKQLEEGDLIRLPKMNVQKSDLKHLQVMTLSTLPSVGEVYATKLIEKFGSIYNVVNATLPQLESVLGKSRAKKVYNYVRGIYDEK
jgi:DNA excision repair protein ERCC-4